MSIIISAIEPRPHPLKSKEHLEAAISEGLKKYNKNFPDRSWTNTAGVQRALVECKQRITFEEFKAALCESFESTLSQGLQPQSALVYVPKHKKSYWWTLQVLAASDVRFRPTNVFFAEFNKNFDENEKLQKQVLFIDDASYTGNQMSDELDNFFKKVRDSRNHHKKITVYVLIPFITNRAKKFIEDNAVRHSSRVKHIIFSSAKIMQTASECLGDDIGEGLGESDSYDREGSKTVTYFDHKMPDTVSRIVLLETLVECDERPLPENFYEGYGDVCVKRPYAPFKKHEFHLETECDAEKLEGPPGADDYFYVDPQYLYVDPTYGNVLAQADVLHVLLFNVSDRTVKLLPDDVVFVVRWMHELERLKKIRNRLLYRSAPRTSNH